jgi:predicted MPP superfamily phosphohydrolase
MNFIKKFAKEISVFGLVIVIFICLFAYRQATFKNYKTVSDSKVTSMVEQKKDFIIVIGDSTDSTMTSFEDVMAEYTTKNRSTNIYFLDTNKIEDADSYVEKTFDINSAYPVTLVVKEGKVTAKNQGALQYYYFKDFIDENK